MNYGHYLFLLVSSCCRGRRSPRASPGSGDGGGWSRGSHMRPSGPPASRSCRRGPPRSTRIRGAGPPAGANAAPPLRLWLPGRSLPSQARAVLLPGPLVAARDSLRELRPPRRRPRRLGPDTESKMAPGARGRALSQARLLPTGAGACLPQRAHAGARCPAPREGLRLPVPGGRVALRAET